MESKIYKYVFLFSVLLSLQHLAFSQLEAYPPVMLERTEVRTLHSEIVGQDYEIFISLPWKYAVEDTIYPVIFTLDPYRSFSIIKGIVDAFTFPFPQMPDVILVGIGYGGEGQEATLNWVIGRTRDMTPVRNQTTEEYYEDAIAKTGVEDVKIYTGGAPLFLDFIREELLPFIESNYRVDSNNRVLCGHSFGGLFALYSLFHDPALFDKYFIGSPSIAYKDGITYDYEINYANTHSDLNADIFMSAGALEERTAENTKKMAEMLLSRNYPHLNLETHIFEKENHVSSFPAALSRALIEVFENDDID